MHQNVQIFIRSYNAGVLKVTNFIRFTVQRKKNTLWEWRHASSFLRSYFRRHFV